MSIDWFTVGAQILNFLVLVWLMKHFLYLPILNAIDKREQRIKDELADADTKKREAKQERDEFTKKNAAFDKQKSDLLAEATEEVNAQRQQMLNGIKNDTDLLRSKRQDSLKRELVSLQAEINRRTYSEVFAIARHALSELSNADLESRMCDVFLERLRNLDDDVKQTIHASDGTNSDTATVRSAMDLSSEQHEMIRQTLNEVFSTEMPVCFETDADVVSGIELTLGGQRIAWSISDYLSSLQESVGELLDADTAQAVETQASATR
jgi:F-type H+-transporting ATPase subunit b